MSCSPGNKHRYLAGGEIAPAPIGKGESVAGLIDNAFNAYNGGRLREACHLFTQRMLSGNATIGMSLAGALTPAGLGIAAVVPLIRAGFVDWIVSTGANLYHDAHFALGLSLHRGSPHFDDVALREQGVVRIYDVVFDYDVLLETDRFIREVSASDEFQRTLSSAEYHHMLGGYLLERERALGLEHTSILGAAHECGVPVYTSSPGDSSIGMNVAALGLYGHAIRFDVSADVNETAAIVLDAKRNSEGSGVLLVGGGSPKNFVLQTEPQIQEVLGIDERGHDFFLQITDARVDTGGLSGATPSEAVSWGKVDPDQLPNAVVCYADCTIGLPLLTAYALDRQENRPLKRLYERRTVMIDQLVAELRKARSQQSYAHRELRRPRSDTG